MKFFTLPLVVLLALTCWCTPARAQITVNFQANVEVSGDKIVLADIAVIKPVSEQSKLLGQLPVASAPPPGQMKELYTVAVINSLRHRQETSQVDWQGSSSIIVKRKGIRIGQDEMQQIILGFLKENKNKLPRTEIRFTLVRAPEEITLESGQLSWQVTPSRPGIMGSTSFSIAFAVDGKPAGNCLVRGRLEAIADVIVAAVNLHRGTRLKPDQLRVQRQDIGDLEEPFFSREELLGMEVARTITAGTPIERAHVITPTVIKEGDLVKIHARKGQLVLTATGLARSNGRRGETIAVKNLSSNKVIHCRVDGPGDVTVEF